eukprot:Clim_evm9s77 gene=Clim_evmTU9s77
MEVESSRGGVPQPPSSTMAMPGARGNRRISNRTVSESSEFWDDADEDENGRAPTSYEAKRANHNALERKRRVFQKDRLNELRRCVPTIKTDKPSTVEILSASTEYIEYVKQLNKEKEQELISLMAENAALVDRLLRAAGPKGVKLEVPTLESIKEVPGLKPEDLIVSEIDPDFSEQFRKQRQATMQALGSIKRGSDASATAAAAAAAAAANATASPNSSSDGDYASQHPPPLHSNTLGGYNTAGGKLAPPRAVAGSTRRFKHMSESDAAHYYADGSAGAFVGGAAPSGQSPQSSTQDDNEANTYTLSHHYPPPPPYGSQSSTYMDDDRKPYSSGGAQRGNTLYREPSNLSNPGEMPRASAEEVSLLQDFVSAVRERTASGKDSLEGIPVRRTHTNSATYSYGASPASVSTFDMQYTGSNAGGSTAMQPPAGHSPHMPPAPPPSSYHNSPGASALSAHMAGATTGSQPHTVPAGGLLPPPRQGPYQQPQAPQAPYADPHMLSSSAPAGHGGWAGPHGGYAPPPQHAQGQYPPYGQHQPAQYYPPPPARGHINFEKQREAEERERAEAAQQQQHQDDAMETESRQAPKDEPEVDVLNNTPPRHSNSGSGKYPQSYGGAYSAARREEAAAAAREDRMDEN